MYKCRILECESQKDFLHVEFHLYELLLVPVYPSGHLVPRNERERRKQLLTFCALQNFIISLLFRVDDSRSIQPSTQTRTQNQPARTTRRNCITIAFL